MEQRYSTRHRSSRVAPHDIVVIVSLCFALMTAHPAMASDDVTATPAPVLAPSDMPTAIAGPLPFAAVPPNLTTTPTTPTVPTLPPMATARRVNDFTVLPLATLSPTAARIVSESEGAITMAVAIPGQQIVYTINPDTQVHLASTAKLLIMLTLLDQTMRAPRDLLDSERELLDAMITVSDNDAADELWETIGGGESVRAFLATAGITGITMNEDEDWGDTAASGEAMATLLAKLVGGQILDAPRRALALDLMTRVVNEQRWGAVTLSAAAVPDSTTIAVKNGWYPDDDGWWVTSAGIIMPNNGVPTYTIAILTNGQPSLEYGVETIETIAREISATFDGQRMVSAVH